MQHVIMSAYRSLGRPREPDCSSEGKFMTNSDFCRISWESGRKTIAEIPGKMAEIPGKIAENCGSLPAVIF